MKKLIYIAGATASGKTDLAIELAKRYNTEIISCDSRQFFKEMSIGTAVPNQNQLSEIPHHFIQHKSISETYNIGLFREEALSCLQTLFQKKKWVVLVGGSGLYADALINGIDKFPPVSEEIKQQLKTIEKEKGFPFLQKMLQEKDPAYFENSDYQNPRRVNRALEICLASGKAYSSFLGKKKAPNFFNTIPLVIQWERPLLYNRINRRVELMIEQGLEQEARELLPFKNHNALQTVGYREWFLYWENKLKKGEVIEEIKKNSRHYAKRQITWINKKYATATTVSQSYPLDKIQEEIEKQSSN